MLENEIITDENDENDIDEFNLDTMVDEDESQPTRWFMVRDPNQEERNFLY